MVQNREKDSALALHFFSSSPAQFRMRFALVLSSSKCNKQPSDKKCAEATNSCCSRKAYFQKDSFVDKLLQMQEHLPKYLFKIVQVLLILTMPSLAAQPTTTFSIYADQTPITIPALNRLSYEDVLRILAFIESDRFEERCSLEELDQINQLVAFLAEEGATHAERPAVEIAAAALYTSTPTYYALHPVIQYYETPSTLLCKSWAKKKWDQTRPSHEYSGIYLWFWQRASEGTVGFR